MKGEWKGMGKGMKGEREKGRREKEERKWGGRKEERKDGYAAPERGSSRRLCQAHGGGGSPGTGEKEG